MANPNLLNITSITAHRKVGTLAVNYGTFKIDNLANSDELVKIISCYLTNKTANTVSIDAYFIDGITEYQFADALDLPPETTIQLVSKDAPIYIPESNSMAFQCSAATSVDCLISYEIMS